MNAVLWVPLALGVGFVAVFVVPMLCFGAGLLAVAAGLFDASALQPATEPRGPTSTTRHL